MRREARATREFPRVEQPAAAMFDRKAEHGVTLGAVVALTLIGLLLLLFGGRAAAEPVAGPEPTLLASLAAIEVIGDPNPAPAAIAPPSEDFPSGHADETPVRTDSEANEDPPLVVDSANGDQLLYERLEMLLSSPASSSGLSVSDLTTARSLNRPQTTDEAIAEAVARGTNPDLKPKKRGGFKKHNNDLFRAQRPIEIMDREMIVRLRLRPKKRETMSIEFKF